MAINKKLIHFKTFDTFNSKKLSADETNKTYTVGVKGSVQTGNPDILYQSICYIKDTKQQWTHGQLYDCSRGDESNIAIYETTDDVYNGVLNSTDELNRLISDSSIYTLIIIQKSGVFDKRIFVFNASDQRPPLFNNITYTCVYSESTNDTGYAINPILYQITKNDGGELYLNKHPLALKSDIPNTDNFALKSEIPDTSNLATQANLTSAVTQLTTNIAKKQDKLVSGTNIATINGISILDSGNFDLATTEQLRSYQPTLVSGTNIKTINSTSLLGSGNIAIKDTKNLTYILNNSTSGTVTLQPNACIYMPNPLTGKLAINACATVSSNNADLIESRICFRMPDSAIIPVIQFNGVAIRWAGGNTPTFVADFTYEVSLFYPSNANSVGPMGVCIGFK